MAPEVQREAMVITKSQPKGKGHGGILAFLRHLLRISLTHPIGPGEGPCPGGGACLTAAVQSDAGEGRAL